MIQHKNCRIVPEHKKISRSLLGDRLMGNKIIYKLVWFNDQLKVLKLNPWLSSDYSTSWFNSNKSSKFFFTSAGLPR
jgi:hypothetical protein